MSTLSTTVKVTLAKAASIIKQEPVPEPSKTLLLQQELLPVKGYEIKVKLAKGAGACQHYSITPYLASDMTTPIHAPIIVHRDDLLRVMELNASYEDRLLSQIIADALANADQPLSVLRTIIEGRTYRI